VRINELHEPPETIADVGVHYPEKASRVYFNEEFLKVMAIPEPDKVVSNGTAPLSHAVCSTIHPD
jgi:hypothetical protein